MKKIAAILTLLLLVATSASAMILAGVLSSYRAPQAPNAPTGVTATAGFQQNTVNWSAGATDGTHDPATSYTLYGGTSASPTSSIYTGSATSYTHTGLTNGTPYYYRLTASNAAGTSGYSSPDAAATPLSPLSDEFVAANGAAYSLTNWQSAKVQTDGTATSGTYVNIQNNALKFHQAYATGTYYGTHVVSANSYPATVPQSVEVSVTGMPSAAAGNGQANLINVYGADCTISTNGLTDKNWLSLRFGGATAGKIPLYISSSDASNNPYTMTLNSNITPDSNPHTYKIVFGSGTVTVFMDGVQQGTAFTHHITWGANMRFGMTYYAYGVVANVFQDYSVDYFRVQ